MVRWQDDIEFYVMHFMPYTHLTAAQKQHESLWVDFPNSYYDPKAGLELYTRYISELVLADKLGYDAVVVNEHHNTAYSMMPSCTLMAATLIPQIRQAKICVFGVPVNLVTPNRLAEEYAMLDVLSNGRLEIALPLGTGMEYWANPFNPATARARFRESVDIMIQAWTEDGPSSYQGEFYNYRYLNVWPKPMQKPYPKLAIVGTGSPETIEFAAQRGWGYASVFVPTAQQVKTFAAMREMSARHGHEMTPEKALVNTIIYVAESDEQAEREAREHIEYYFTTALRTTPRYLAPPGYISLDQFRIRASAANLHGGFSWKDMTENWRVVCGTPQHVAEKLTQWCDEAQSSRVIFNPHLGDMPHWKVVKNLTLFAEEVMPIFRQAKAKAGRTAAAAAFRGAAE